MNCIANRLPYRQTRSFTKFAADYVDGAEALRPLFLYPPSFAGIQRSIEQRRNFPTNRKVLVEELRKQYGTLLKEKVGENVDALLSNDTFTITTAHQPALLTGPLYFIYKILHAIKLAKELNTSLPQYKFVPVYYMGSEDADLEELNHIYLDGQKLVWDTKQTGAVGRMKVDDALLQLISRAAGQVAVLSFGQEIIDTLTRIFKKGELVQDAMFRFIHELFSNYGLVVLIPDTVALKKEVLNIFKNDLLDQLPSELVGRTIEKIQASGYKTQAHPRDINLFYLSDGIRNRIVKENEAGGDQGSKSKVKTNGKANGQIYRVQDAGIEFTEDELMLELNEHTDRFSPNVILRGIFQETILPNIVFIGGGAEIAYWMQYSDLFKHYQVPYPVLLLRNSFLIIEKNLKQKISKLGFTLEDLFLPEEDIVNKLVVKESSNEMKLNGALPQVEQLYEQLKQQASKVDITLSKHVDALRVHAVHRLHELEKKMLRAEKRKFADQQRQIHSIKSKLFPGNGLQERYDSMLYYYAKWGKSFIDQLYEHSLGLEQEFVVLEINRDPTVE